MKRLATVVGSSNPEAVRKICGCAGCKTSRKLTGGGMLIVERMLVKSWSSTQATVAASSGDAKFHALVRGATEALGLKAVLDKLDNKIDSAAAKSMGCWLGLG